MKTVATPAKKFIKRKVSLHARQKAKEASVASAIAIAITLPTDAPIYFDTFTDWRGRTYYKAPHLNPQSTDRVKALFNMPKKRLGIEGMHWLSWSVATMFGYDKQSFEARVRWSSEHFEQLQEMYHSADVMKHPLVIKADVKSKYMFISHARELVQASMLPNPADYECGVIISVDGTCSGLQILSMAGLDALGGAKVNVNAAEDDGEAKADIYGLVAKAINSMKDDGKEDPKGINAYLRDRTLVTRNVAKKPVMVVPYAAGFDTLKDSIREQLNEEAYVRLSEGVVYRKNDKEKKPMPEPAFGAILVEAERISKDSGEIYMGFVIENLGDVSLALIANEITQKLLAVLEVEMPLAMAIMKSFNKDVPCIDIGPISWTTSDGLVCTQLYLKTSVKQVQRARDRLITTISGAEVVVPRSARKYGVLTDEINSVKARNGMSPNWVHSGDSTILRQVVRELGAKGVHCCMIHDSFGAVPADMPLLRVAVQKAYQDFAASGSLEAFWAEQGRELPEGLNAGTLTPSEITSEFTVC